MFRILRHHLRAKDKTTQALCETVASQPKDGVGDSPTLVSSAPKDDCCFFQLSQEEAGEMA